MVVGMVIIFKNFFKKITLGLTFEIVLKNGLKKL